MHVSGILAHIRKFLRFLMDFKNLVPMHRTYSCFDVQGRKLWKIIIKLKRRNKNCQIIRILRKSQGSWNDPRQGETTVKGHLKKSPAFASFFVTAIFVRHRVRNLVSF